MKKILIFILILFLSVQSFAQQNEYYQSQFEKANEFYTNEKYSEAIEIYEQLISSDIISADVYYNAANCYFKQKSFSSAILYYEKALKIDPTNDDIIFNLEIANQFITDKIEPLPQLFYITWWKNIYQLFSLKTWTIITIIAAILVSLFLILFVLSKTEFSKKISFYLIIFFVFNLIIAFSASKSIEKILYSTDNAIVSVPSLTVKSAPANNSTNLFVIHEGTKVNVQQTNGNWAEIMLEDGNLGWVEKSTLITI